jgi:hypothetical protein
MGCSLILQAFFSLLNFFGQMIKANDYNNVTAMLEKIKRITNSIQLNIHLVCQELQFSVKLLVLN